jgi:hypothetical protein
MAIAFFIRDGIPFVTDKISNESSHFRGDVAAVYAPIYSRYHCI